MRTEVSEIRERLSCLLPLALVATVLLGPIPAGARQPPAENEGKLRIIAFGAHPDDAEFKVGGVAAMWAAAGHHVKLVSVTNGDIGHWQIAGGPLARRRAAEVKEASRRIGTTAEVLDIHDGELLPTLENRKKIVRQIRQWGADLVLTHRPNDYHPDHRYTGILVQDAAFMVTVPYFCPDTPRLKKNPVFMYYSDRFRKPNPFEADIAVSIDAMFEKKLDAVDALESQVYEGGALGSAATLVERFANDKVRRREWASKSWSRRMSREADQSRSALIKWYGAEKGKAVKHAEAFEVCEYGRQPSADELRKLFPFFPSDP